ncbi:hypothetical protein SELMODRAFT_422380 [Selaginella moellendorffii]|uniref:Uncharacterized protein n=1 Tax=Selaginella moellendorffii TaxID=88036 RepID=D8SI77_SELML|nr:hypothetical protein SELMODRAFT_422380 [Selaginella moellendorffii]
MECWYSFCQIELGEMQVGCGKHWPSLWRLLNNPFSIVFEMKQRPLPFVDPGEKSIGNQVMILFWIVILICSGCFRTNIKQHPKDFKWSSETGAIREEVGQEEAEIFQAQQLGSSKGRRESQRKRRQGRNRITTSRERRKESKCLNLFGGMVQDGWALACFCDAPDVPIVLKGQSLPFMGSEDYLINPLVRPREGIPAQFQVLLLPSFKFQLQELYNISACGDNVPLDGAQSLLLPCFKWQSQEFSNINARGDDIPLDGAQFLLLLSFKWQSQKFYNISGRILGGNVPLDGTRAATSIVQESDALLIIGSTVMVLPAFRLVSATHKGKTRADEIACFEIGSCVGEVSLSMELSSLVSIHPIGCCPHKGECIDSETRYNVGFKPLLEEVERCVLGHKIISISIPSQQSQLIEHGTIGLALLCKQGFLVLFDSLTTATEGDGSVVEMRRNVQKIVEVRSEPRLRVGFAGEVAACCQLIKLLQVKLSKKELTHHNAVKFMMKKANLFSSTDGNFSASFFVYDENTLVMIKDEGNGFKTTALTKEQSVLVIGSGARQARMILAQPVRGQNHGEAASVGEALSLGLDAFAQACVENPECGGDLCVIDGSRNIDFGGMEFKKALASAKSNFSFQYARRGVQRNALNIKIALFDKQEEAASARDSSAEKVQSVKEQEKEHNRGGATHCFQEFKQHQRSITSSQNIDSRELKSIKTVDVLVMDQCIGSKPRSLYARHSSLPSQLQNKGVQQAPEDHLVLKKVLHDCLVLVREAMAAVLYDWSAASPSDLKMYLKCGRSTGRNGTKCGMAKVVQNQQVAGNKDLVSPSVECGGPDLI